MAHRTASQLARRRRIEGAIRLAAPFLDVVLAVGERVSRVAGRGDVEPDPPVRLDGHRAVAPPRGPGRGH